MARMHWVITDMEHLVDLSIFFIAKDVRCIDLELHQTHK